MRVGIIGLGMVGKEVLLNLYHFSAVQEIFLFDINKEKLQAEVDDFCDTGAVAPGKFHKKLTIVNDCAGVKDCEVVIVNVGAKAKGKFADRIQVLGDNETLMKEIAPHVAKNSPNAIVIITSNPVDAIAGFFAKYSKMSLKRIVGSGTLLDSARLSLFLSEHYGVHQNSFTAWVLGEHGSTSFIPWSLVRVAGMPLTDFENLMGIKPISRGDVLQRVVARGLAIFNTRGYTDHGIGASVFRIFTAITQNEKSILPVTCPLSGEYGITGVHIGGLAILGKSGIEKVLEVSLLPDEVEAYKKSASFLKNAVAELK